MDITIKKEELTEIVEKSVTNKFSQPLQDTNDKVSELNTKFEALEKSFNQYKSTIKINENVDKARENNIGFKARLFLAQKRLGLSASEVVELWKKNSPDTAYIEKNILAGDLSAGGTLAQINYSQDVIPLLFNAAVMRKGGATVISGISNLKIPKITSGFTAYHVGEAASLTKSAIGTGMINMATKKIGALAAESNDLIKMAIPGTDAMLQNHIITAIAVQEDYDMLMGAGTENVMKGLTKWVNTANSFARTTSGTYNSTTIKADLMKAFRLVLAENMDMTRAGWIMHSTPYCSIRSRVDANSNPMDYARELTENGTLLGFPVYVTNGCPTTSVFFNTFNNCIILDGSDFEFAMSDSASYTDSSTLKSAFEYDMTVFRAIKSTDFAAKYDKGIAEITSVDWSA